MYTPETLAYPYSLSAPEQPIRDRTIITLIWLLMMHLL